MEKGNKKSFINRKIYYTHEDSDGLSNSEEGESYQDIRSLMEFEKDTSEAKDTFMDALGENDFLEETINSKYVWKRKKLPYIL